MEIWQLQELKLQGYQVLYRQNTKAYFIPLKNSYESLLDKINDAPMWEDEVIDINEAISHYPNYKEYLQSMFIVLENESEH
ncbi:hypothetical protein [Sphingobacterium siyangense]|uniref:hypothetical protein n=1 Tax=Sphingobacterium siyangense TaxID=459529 RepID=UPI002FD8AF38